MSVYTLESRTCMDFQLPVLSCQYIPVIIFLFFCISWFVQGLSAAMDKQENCTYIQPISLEKALTSKNIITSFFLILVYELFIKFAALYCVSPW